MSLLKQRAMLTLSDRLNVRDYLRHIAMETHELNSFMDEHPLTAYFSRTPRSGHRLEPALRMSVSDNRVNNSLPVSPHQSVCSRD